MLIIEWVVCKNRMCSWSEINIQKGRGNTEGSDASGTKVSSSLPPSLLPESLPFPPPLLLTPGVWLLPTWPLRPYSQFSIQAKWLICNRNQIVTSPWSKQSQQVQLHSTPKQGSPCSKCLPSKLSILFPLPTQLMLSQVAPASGTYTCHFSSWALYSLWYVDSTVIHLGRTSLLSSALPRPLNPYIVPNTYLSYPSPNWLPPSSLPDIHRLPLSVISLCTIQGGLDPPMLGTQ